MLAVYNVFKMFFPLQYLWKSLRSLDIKSLNAWKISPLTLSGPGFADIFLYDLLLI